MQLLLSVALVVLAQMVGRHKREADSNLGRGHLLPMPLDPELVTHITVDDD